MNLGLDYKKKYNIKYFENYIASNKTKLIKEIRQCSEYIANKTHPIETQSYYKDLYVKFHRKYLSLLKDIEKTRADDLIKQTNTNSLFRLLCQLKIKDNSYDIKKAQQEFRKIESPCYSSLTDNFKNIFKKNLSLKIYYRKNFDCNLTNYISLKKFNLSTESTINELITLHPSAE
ncbi:14818_t:CDS:2, partial [Gigaspora margarita]